MVNNKNFTAPVWWIAAIIFVKMAMAVFLFISMQHLLSISEEFYDPQLRRVFRNQLISQTVLIFILLAEAITYWKIRRRIEKKKLVWVHIVSLLMAFAVLPVFFMLYTTLLATRVVAADYSSRVRTTGISQTIIVWTFLIVGHVFFVMVLIDAFRKRKEVQPPAPDSPDILNDYA